jgi:midasin (ATPase involved in ribosome maturation)
VNFCAPSVLDRLNGLLEPGGALVLNERGVLDGQVPTIIPHPDFRLILAMDPRNGEISRAMRNRSLELFLPSLDASEDSDVIAANGLLSSKLESDNTDHQHNNNQNQNLKSVRGLGLDLFSGVLQKEGLLKRLMERGFSLSDAEGLVTSHRRVNGPAMGSQVSQSFTLFHRRSTYRRSCVFACFCLVVCLLFCFLLGCCFF